MASRNALSDPTTYGEDLPGNLRRVLELAQRHCAGCADYHIRCVAHRAAGERFGIDTDRGALVAVVEELVGRGLSRQSRLDIVIAGSADTGVLATVAHAVARLGDEALQRCHFTVLDLCPTPLLLCEHFAGEHGLDFSSAAVDLTAQAKKFPADIIVMHSVFRFIDRSVQPAVLGELGAWLKPGGSLVFSNRIKSASREEAEAERAIRSARNERFAAVTARGELDVADDREAIMARLDRWQHDHESRAGEFSTVGDLKKLLENAALPLTRFDEIEWAVGGDGRPYHMRKRVIAVLTSAL